MTTSLRPEPGPGLVDGQGSTLSRLARFGRLLVLPSTDSTNNVAKRLISDQRPTIVVADTQTGARGRFSRSWYSPPGSLSFSLLLFPEMPREQLGLVPLVAGLAVAKAVQRLTTVEPALLWPNDVMVGDKKLAGILCEARSTGLVIGIGLNMNQSSFPPQLPQATSLLLLTGREFNRFEMLAAVLDEFERAYQALRDSQLPALLGELKSRMPMLGQPVRIETGWAGLGSIPFGTAQGTALDITERGELVLQTAAGAARALSAGKVVSVR